MLEIVDLTCIRGDRTLFSNVTARTDSGTLLRVAGPNGSGKTSLLRIVCGLMRPAEGEVRWNGADTSTLREEFWKDLVYIGHVNAVKDDLTGLENLRIGGAISGRHVEEARALEALEKFGIARCADLPARVMSQGQRRRVALARLTACANIPLWVLDEPLNALDAAAVAFMQSLMAEHLHAGGQIVFTTHQEVAIDAPKLERIELV